MTEISEFLQEGSNLEVICSTKINEQYCLNSINQSARGNFYVRRVCLGAFDKNNLIKRLFYQLTRVGFYFFICLTKVKRGDTIIAVTNPPFNILSMSLVKLFTSCNLVFLVHDVFPENLIPIGVMKKGNICYKILLKCFNWSYMRADKIILIGEDMKEHFLNKVDEKIVNLQVIPNWVNEEILEFTARSAELDIVKQISNNGLRMIVYSGNIGRAQGLDRFMNLLCKLKKPLPFNLVIIGDGSLTSNLKNLVETEGLDNIYFLGYLERAIQYQYLVCSDVCLVSLAEGMGGLAVPSKTYDIMALGKPILYYGDVNSQVDRYIKEFDCGWSFNTSRDCELLDFLNNFNLLSEELLILKGKSSKESSKLFSKQNLLKHYE
jgi:glycosyltransferase involved in cell wall biosynthesis